MLVNVAAPRSRQVRPASTAGTTVLTPLCGEEEFADLLESLVADEAPRLFAVVQEYGEQVDGRIAAWGMAFPDRAEIVSVERGTWTSLAAPESALRMFKLGSDIQVRLVWVPAVTISGNCDVGA
jgi:hypothetical protein